MKVIINENERGFLFQNGKFVRMLEPGKHHIWSLKGETFFKITVGRVVIAKELDTYTQQGSDRVVKRHTATVNEIDLQVLLRDKQFANSITKIEVPDVHFALHFEDGRMVEALQPGVYYFWKIYHEHTFQIIAVSQPRVELPKEMLALIPSKLYSKAEIPEGQAGLLYFDGKFQEQLAGGSYYFWNGAVKVSVQLVDLRIQQMDISSQEILTADKVTLRLNFVCTYKIIDAVSINNTLKDYKDQIYVITQLALREYIGRLKLDELLEQKDSIADLVLEKLKEKQNGLFIEFIHAGLKDIILPGEIRDIMNTVLIAEKNAQANVIARREEVASTRSLLNTARLMEENTTLYKLKELEYLEKICDKVGSISVGNGNLLGQLSEIINARK